MININRSSISPTSLLKSEIKGYLDELANYISLPLTKRENIKVPKCNESYRNADIFEAFDKDFHSKCYLTEKKYFNSYGMDIEHFRSKGFSQFPHLKYDWNNLFPADHDANMLKPKNEPEGGYLNPCVDNVEEDLNQKLLENGKSDFSPKNDTNLKAKNTAALLNKIHNGHDFYSNKKAENLRFEISKKVYKVRRVIMEWQVAIQAKEQDLVQEKEIELKIMLSRKSAFTMLLRSIDSVRYNIPQNFLD